MKQRSLMAGSYKSSLIISTLIIVLVQSVSLIVVMTLAIRDINSKAAATADEMGQLLAEPMYNVDDEQTLRIAESLISSGRLSGIRITSTASGVLIDTWKKNSSPWIKNQTRNIRYDDIDLGEMTFLYGDADLVTFLKFYALVSLGMLSGLLVAYYLGSRWLVQKKVQKTFSELIKGINQLSGEHSDYNIPRTGYADIDPIIIALNSMSKKVSVKNLELKEINDNLETRVTERTAELESSLAELRLMQERLIESGKLSALGRLSAGIAHEFNTPLGAIISAIGMLNEWLDNELLSHYTLLQGCNSKELDLFNLVVSRGLAANTTLNLPEISRKELKETAKLFASAQIPEGERVAEQLLDLGLSETLHDFLPLLRVPRSPEIVTAAVGPVMARRMGEIIAESGRKASGVISALRSYLSSDNSEVAQPVNVDGDIRKVLTLLHNILKAGINIKTEFSGVRATGFPDRLSLVWMNLIRNAVQAMEFRGELVIQTFGDGDKAVIQITDDGPGIPDGDHERIFEPFYTTKEHGEGMGLGLDICKRIIDNHKGSISVESRPGKTTFSVILPALKMEQGV